MRCWNGSLAPNPVQLKRQWFKVPPEYLTSEQKQLKEPYERGLIKCPLLKTSSILPECDTVHTSVPPPPLESCTAENNADLASGEDMALGLMGQAALREFATRCLCVANLWLYSKKKMNNYLQKQTIWSITEGCVAIYLRHFPTLFAIYVIPLIPLKLLEAWALYVFPSVLNRIVIQLLAFIGTTIVYFPFAIAVSEICVGIRPSVSRAYARAFSSLGRTLGTYLLYCLVVFLGSIVIIPGLFFFVWYLFTAPVVVVESVGGMKALQRSRELGRGFYMRNVGIFLFLYILLVLVAAVVTMMIVASTFDFDNFKEFQMHVDSINGVFEAVAMPPVLILPILLYYDMRTRKEGYGALQLAEDMRL